MGTAIKHPLPDQVKPSFVIFDIRHSDAQPLKLNFFYLTPLCNVPVDAVKIFLTNDT